MVWSKESRQSRGYDSAWERTRQRVVERDGGMCQECRRGGRTAIGREVDHIVPKAEAEKRGWPRSRRDALANLQLLCTECHRAKTARDNGGTYRKKVEYGMDGWPLDNPGGKG